MVGVEHTSFDDQQAFLRLPVEQQNLKIWLNGNETNGKVAEALRRISKAEQAIVTHDTRLVKLERWQLSVLAVLAFIIGASAPFFWFLDRVLFN